MNIFPNLLETRKSFWFFQIFGFLLFTLFDYGNNIHWLQDALDFVYWLSSITIFFFITILLRFLYRLLYKRISKLLGISLIILISSLIGAVVWFYLRGLVYTSILSMGTEDYFDYLSTYSRYGYYRAFWILFIYMVIWSTIYYGLKLWIDLNNEKRRLELVSKEAQEAKLKMLRYQINPHFLFNTLNTIQGLMYKNTKRADEMLTEFSELLRFSLKHDDQTYLPLETEVDIAKKYLFIQKIRYEDRLEYSIDIHPKTKKIEVLGFIIQPLLENAIKHGLKINQELLNIELKSYISNSNLVVQVENSGRWIPVNDTNGLGIKNIINRLKNAYPGKHTFNIQKENNKVLVKIEIQLI